MKPRPDPHRVRDVVRGTGDALREVYPPDAAADEALHRLIERLEGLPGTSERKLDQLAERAEHLPANIEKGKKR